MELPPWVSRCRPNDPSASRENTPQFLAKTPPPVLACIARIRSLPLRDQAFCTRKLQWREDWWLNVGQTQASYRKLYALLKLLVPGVLCAISCELSTERSFVPRWYFRIRRSWRPVNLVVELNVKAAQCTLCDSLNLYDLALSHPGTVQLGSPLKNGVKVRYFERRKLVARWRLLGGPCVGIWEKLK